MTIERTKADSKNGTVQRGRPKKRFDGRKSSWPTPVQPMVIGLQLGNRRPVLQFGERQSSIVVERSESKRRSTKQVFQSQRQSKCSTEQVFVRATFDRANTAVRIPALNSSIRIDHAPIVRATTAPRPITSAVTGDGEWIFPFINARCRPPVDGLVIRDQEFAIRSR